jgi:thioredoxin-dependent peroxiredoxin
MKRGFVMKWFVAFFTIGLFSCSSPPTAPQKKPPTPESKTPTPTPSPITTTAPVDAGVLPEIGTKAPAIQLKNQRGELVELASFVGKKAVVLYFYPKDDTPGCTTEAKDFRDRNAEIEALGAKVIGVSLDAVASHEAFADKYDLNFDILSDAEQAAAKTYGVLGAYDNTPITKRTTFLIGKDGTIKKIFAEVQVSVHGEEVVKALKEGLGG